MVRTFGDQLSAVLRGREGETASSSFPTLTISLSICPQVPLITLFPSTLVDSVDEKMDVGSATHSPCSSSHLVEHADFTYADFIKYKETNQTLRASDYSWETHGYSIANRFYTDIGIVLDEKFSTAKKFTYYT